MLKNYKLNYVGIVIAPSIALMVYVFCVRWFEISSQNKYEYNWWLLVFEILWNALIGIYLLVECKHVFKSKSSKQYRSAYLIGIILVLALFACTFIPFMDWGVLVFFLFNCIPQFSIITAVHLGIFIWISRKNSKTE